MTALGTRQTITRLCTTLALTIGLSVLTSANAGAMTPGSELTISHTQKGAKILTEQEMSRVIGGQSGVGAACAVYGWIEVGTGPEGLTIWGLSCLIYASGEGLIWVCDVTGFCDWFVGEANGYWNEFINWAYGELISGGNPEIHYQPPDDSDLSHSVVFRADVTLNLCAHVGCDCYAARDCESGDCEGGDETSSTLGVCGDGDGDPYPD